MIDRNSQFFAILTNIGIAKQANADALGIPWKITQMGVGDAHGSDPMPNPAQTQLINEQRRAPLNQLKVDPNNVAVIIAEQVIPENAGGWWIREIGLYDEDVDLVAVANCAPSFKPLLAQGSGRTQVVRMHLIVSSSANVELKIDPGVVLATRAYVDSRLLEVLPDSRQPGTYTKVRANKQGVVVEGLQLTAADIPELEASKITEGVLDPARLPLYVRHLAEKTAGSEYDPDLTTAPLILTDHKNGPVPGRYFYIQSVFYPEKTDSSAQIAIAYDQSVAMYIRYAGHPADTHAPAKRTWSAWVRSDPGSSTGQVAWFAQESPPDGWIAAQGQLLFRTRFGNLFAAIGTRYGVGDGRSTFQLPDLRGEFIRGWDNERGIDKNRALGSYQGKLLERHAHNATSEESGEHGHIAWVEASGVHDHGFRFEDNGENLSLAYSITGKTASTLEMNGGKQADNRRFRTDFRGLHSHRVGVHVEGKHRHIIQVEAAGGIETRPRNLALLGCIKY